MTSGAEKVIKLCNRVMVYKAQGRREESSNKKKTKGPWESDIWDGAWEERRRQPCKSVGKMCFKGITQRGDSGMFKEQKQSSSEWNLGDKKKRQLEVLAGCRKDFQIVSVGLGGHWEF